MLEDESVDDTTTYALAHDAKAAHYNRLSRGKLTCSRDHVHKHRHTNEVMKSPEPGSQPLPLLRCETTLRACSVFSGRCQNSQGDAVATCPVI